MTAARIKPLPPAVSEQARRRVFKEIALFIFALASFMLFLFVTFGDEGLLALYRDKARYRAVQADLERARREHATLKEHVEILRHDPRALEVLAREELRLVLPGEVLYLFREDGSADSSGRGVPHP